MTTFDDTQHPRSHDGTFAEKPRSAAEIALARPLNDIMEFDHVITVGADGSIADADGLYAPDVYMDDDHPVEGSGWTVLRGFTGQHGYGGHVMHPSEFIGGGLEDHIRQNPGHYVVVEVRDEDGEFDDAEPVGWAIAYRPLAEEQAPALA